MAKARRTTLAILAALVAAMMALGGVASAQQEGTITSPSPTAPPEGQAEQLRVENPGTGDSGSLSQAQRQALSRGYLVPDEEAYERAKAEAAERADRLSAEDAPAPPEATAAPRTLRSWEGIRDGRASPSDSTGAIGPHPLHRADKPQVRHLRPRRRRPDRQGRPERAGRDAAVAGG